MTLKILGRPVTPQAPNTCVVCGNQIGQSPGYNLLRTAEGSMHVAPCGMLEVFRALVTGNGVVFETEAGDFVYTADTSALVTTPTFELLARTPFNLTRTQLDELLDEIVETKEQLTVTADRKTEFRKVYGVTRGPRD